MTKQNNKCKNCRRLGTKLFLKSDKCLSPKCVMVKRSYFPGQRGKRKSAAISEYGKELKEKQVLKKWYNLKERQFGKYVKEALGKRRTGDAGVFLIRKLESRLDNVIFRLGLSSSRAQARQLISHGHFLVNGKKINIPSYEVKKGDRISVSPVSVKKTTFQNLTPFLKKYQPPSWLKLNAEKMEGEPISLPSLGDAKPPAEISLIFEYYSK